MNSYTRACQESDEILCLVKEKRHGSAKWRNIVFWKKKWCYEILFWNQQTIQRLKQSHKKRQEESMKSLIIKCMQPVLVASLAALGSNDGCGHEILLAALTSDICPTSEQKAAHMCHNKPSGFRCSMHITRKNLLLLPLVAWHRWTNFACVEHHRGSPNCYSLLLHSLAPDKE